MLSSGNPALSAVDFAKPQRWADIEEARPRTMTIAGSISATAILLGVCAASAIAVWSLVPQNMVIGVGLVSGLAGFVLALVISFKPRTAQYLGFVYAILEGAFLAGISLFWVSFAASRQGGEGVVASLDTGLITQSVLLTFGVSGAMLIAYGARLLRATPMFIKGVFGATIGLLIAVFGSMLLRLFLGSDVVPHIWQMGTLGIAISAGVVVLAALWLVIDFHIIEEGAASGQPKWMEWYAAFGLLVTLVWLYVAILRLLALLQSRE
ncbi:MAG: Bax inhibitor-1/YccA family protein [Phycisphaerales bacterium JB039]